MLCRWRICKKWVFQKREGSTRRPWIKLLKEEQAKFVKIFGTFWENLFGRLWPITLRLYVYLFMRHLSNLIIVISFFNLRFFTTLKVKEVMNEICISCSLSIRSESIRDSKISVDLEEIFQYFRSQVKVKPQHPNYLPL